MRVGGVAKNIAVSAVMAAVLILGKLVLHMVPNVEVVTSFIIVFTCVFGIRRTMPAVLAFCLLDIFLYPFSLDVTVQYFFYWPLLCLMTALLARRLNGKTVAFVLEAIVMALLFWLETPTIMCLMYSMAFYPLLVSGVAFMVSSLVSGAVSVLLFYPILYRVLSRVKQSMFQSDAFSDDSHVDAEE